MSTSYVLLTLIWLVLANLAWFGKKPLWLLRVPKTLPWCVLELALYYGVALLVSWVVERQQEGHIVHQDWEFYVISACVFLILGFPGFVNKVLR